MLVVGDLLMDCMRRNLGLSRQTVEVALSTISMRKFQAAGSLPGGDALGTAAETSTRRTPYFDGDDIAAPCCGAAATLVTSDEELVAQVLASRSQRHAGSPVVEVLGVGEGSSNPSFLERQSPVIFATAIREAFAATADDAGVRPATFAGSGFAVVHDAFPSIELAFLLGMGLEWHRAVERIRDGWSQPLRRAPHLRPRAGRVGAGAGEQDPAHLQRGPTAPPADPLGPGSDAGHAGLHHLGGRAALAHRGVAVPGWGRRAAAAGTHQPVGGVGGAPPQAALRAPRPPRAGGAHLRRSRPADAGGGRDLRQHPQLPAGAETGGHRQAHLRRHRGPGPPGAPGGGPGPAAPLVSLVRHRGRAAVVPVRRLPGPHRRAGGDGRGVEGGALVLPGGGGHAARAAHRAPQGGVCGCRSRCSACASRGGCAGWCSSSPGAASGTRRWRA